MIIKNITDAKNAPKVIGFGTYWIMPGEEKTIPDAACYTLERDGFGNSTGKKVIVPGILTHAKLGNITFTETKKAAHVPANDPAPAGTPAEVDAAPVEEKKLTPAEKRAMTRAANAAAKAAATAE